MPSSSTLVHQEQVQRLFLRHQAQIRACVFALLPDRAAAEDVFQEVFLIVSRKAQDFAEGSNFLAWVRAIARFQVLAHYRDRSRSALLFGSDVLDALSQDEGDEDLDWESEKRALGQCMGQLAERSRTILFLRYHKDLSPTVIGGRLGWTANAVNVALSRARGLLRDCVRRRLEGAVS